MSAPPEALLPRGARRFTAGMAALAVALTVAVAGVAGLEVDPVAVLLLTVLVVAGEHLTADFTFRHGGVMSFSLSDTVLTAGFLLVGGPEVMVAGTLAVAGLQLFERMPPHKQAFNLAQTVVGFAAAALVVELLAPAGGGLSGQAVAATAAGMALLSFVNTASVGAMVALTSGERWTDVVGRSLPTAGLLVAGNLCLGVLVVVLVDTHAWALPALAMPVALLHRASRAEVSAQVGRERARVHVSTEQRLAGATSTAEVATILGEGAAELLGVDAAVWHRGRWAGEVPRGSGACPLDPQLTTALVSRGPGLGPAVAGPCAAIGVDGGVLVVWGDELRLDDDAREWFERFARSGRVHFARAAAASALAKEQDTLRAVVDGTADGICVLDHRGVVRVWNPAMSSLAGVPAQEALGVPAAEVLGAGPWEDDGIHDVVRPGDRVWRVAISAVADRGHGALRVAVVHDVSAERRVARMKDDMLAVVSHELRTPLTPIKASAQLLLRRWERMSSEQREGLLGQVLGSADHLNRLVDDLLLVAQLSTSSRSAPNVRLAPVDLAAVVVEGVDALRVGHPDHPICAEVPDELPALSDPLRLRQVIDNLVVNACKFSEPGAPVDVRLSEVAGEAVLTVRDRGRGIPPEDLERVFERFERVEDPLVMTTSGAGLGLYIVRALIEALGGTIRLESTVGEGTTAVARFPLLRVPDELADRRGVAAG
jgi:signal transduction histidine kinase